MLHRLALLIGGTGAAGVLALALALGGFGAPLPSTPGAFVPVANNALGGGQVTKTEAAPTDQPATTSLGGGDPQKTTRKEIDTVYVLPAPAAPVTHAGKPGGDNSQSGDTPRQPGGNNAGDDNNAGEDQNDDQAGEDDHSNDGDHSDDGGGDDGGHEPGDD